MVSIIYIVYNYIVWTFFFGTNLLSPKNTQTDRLLIEFNGLWYSLAARQVFVAIANPVTVVWVKSPTPETHIAPNHTPTIADAVPKWLNTPTLRLGLAYSVQLMQLLGPLVTTRQAGGYLDLEGGNRICMVLEWTLGLKRLAYSRINLIVSVAASVYISREHGRLRTTRHFV